MQPSGRTACDYLLLYCVVPFRQRVAFSHADVVDLMRNLPDDADVLQEESGDVIYFTKVYTNSDAVKAPASWCRVSEHEQTNATSSPEVFRFGSLS